MRRIKALIVLLAGLTMSTMASAQSMEQQMDQMFGQMSSVTKPQVVNGAERDVVSGGSIAIRSPIMNTSNAVNFSPPGITAGCGGIDLYGGSFSYISGQQFVQMLRSIAANAEGLAFQMALEAMSNQLSQHLTSFSDKMLQNVLAMKNSCEIAQSALTSTGAASAITGWGNSVGQSMGTYLGQYSDASQAVQNNTPGNSAIAQMAQSNPSLTNQLYYVNMVWAAINTNQTSMTFSLGGGGSTLNQEMMSITGTIVVCQVGVDPNCAPSSASSPVTTSGQTSLRFLPPTIHLQDLLFGTTGENGTATGAQYLKCDESQRCMNPSPTTWTNPGYLTLVNNMLGTGTTAGGIVGDLIQGNALSSQEQGFMTASGAAGPLIFKVASHNPTAVYGYAQSVATPLALELAFQHGMSVINMVSASLKNVQTPGKDELIKDLNNVRMQWINDYNNMRSQDHMNTDFAEEAKVYLDNSEDFDIYAPQNVGMQ